MGCRRRYSRAAPGSADPIPSANRACRAGLKKLFWNIMPLQSGSEEIRPAALIPHPPDAVDIAVMHHEERVQRRIRLSHDAAHEYVDQIVRSCSSVPLVPQNSQLIHDWSRLFCPTGRLVPNVSNGDSVRIPLIIPGPTVLSGNQSVGVASRCGSNSGLVAVNVGSTKAGGIRRSSVQSQYGRAKSLLPVSCRTAR